MTRRKDFQALIATSRNPFKGNVRSVDGLNNCHVVIQIVVRAIGEKITVVELAGYYKTWVTKVCSPEDQF